MKLIVCVVLAAVANAQTYAPTGGAPHYPYNMQQGNQVMGFPAGFHGHQRPMNQMNQMMMMHAQHMIGNQNTQAPGNYGNQNQGNNGMAMLPFILGGGDKMQRFAAMNMMMGPGQSNNMLPLALMEGENMLPLAMMSGQNNRQSGSQNGAVNPMMWMAFDTMM